MSVFKDILGFVGKATGITSVGDAAQILLDRIKADPDLEQKIREMELEKFKLELQENQSVRQLLSLEIQSEDKFVKRARPATLWIVIVILVGNFIVLPILNLIAVGFGLSPIQVTYPTLPEEVYWLFGALFSVYTGARSWDKRNKKI
jgi:hypothetical protein